MFSIDHMEYRMKYANLGNLGCVRIKASVSGANSCTPDEHHS